MTVGFPVISVWNRSSDVEERKVEVKCLHPHGDHLRRIGTEVDNEDVDGEGFYERMKGRNQNTVKF